MHIGWSRVSTDDRNPDLRLAALPRAGRTRAVASTSHVSHSSVCRCEAARLDAEPFLEAVAELSDKRRHCGQRVTLAALVARAGGEAAGLHRIATGATVEPVPPWIFSGCITNANS